MIHKIARYIDKHKLLDSRSKVLVALSGGADSVALLIALRKLGYHCEAIHCNFHLRGEESMRDEDFVKALCARLDIKLQVIHFDTDTYAKEKGISIEMAARELRYTAFEQHRRDIGADVTAVAHHRDDSVETFLLNLTRGTGIRGLHGIQARNGNIIRPLLCVGREEIIDYLQWRKEEYVIDSTNLESLYTRNKIRLEILPKLEEINPSIRESIASTAHRLREAELIYNKAIEEAVARVKKGELILIDELKKEVAPATLLHEILSPLGFNGRTVEEIAESVDKGSGLKFCSKEWSVIKDRNRFIITPLCLQERISATLPWEGIFETPDGTLKIERSAFDGNIYKDRNIACLDAEKMAFPLSLRNTRRGDRFAPFGMRGTKLVSDYLTDRKASITEKEHQLVVTDAEDNIIWLVGERPSAPFCIDGNTKEILCIKWKKRPNRQ